MANYNIRQLTNFDVKDNPVERTIVIHGKNVEYCKISYQQLLDIEGATSTTIKINKLGYCVNDNEGINYPIFIDFTSPEGTDYIPFQIGKTGMFEFQPEQWMDVNENVEDEDDEETASVDVYSLLVPKLVKNPELENDSGKIVPFVLDYCFEV